MFIVLLCCDGALGKNVNVWTRSFAVSRPSVWNDLPLTLRASSTTLGQFQNKLKTVLFCLAYET